MATASFTSDVPLPSNWPSSVKSAILQVISLARLAIIQTRSWACDSISSRVRLQASLEWSRSNRTDLRPRSSSSCPPRLPSPSASAPGATGDGGRGTCEMHVDLVESNGVVGMSTNEIAPYAVAEAAAFWPPKVDGPADAPVTGAEKRMKESCRKGVANHPDPESCGVDREGGAEALTGARAGEVSSREINVPGTPTPLLAAEGNTGRDGSASPSRARRGRRPSACTETPRTGTGRSQGPPWMDGTVERAGKARGRTPAMHDPGKSDGPIVPKKQTNKAPPWATESAEERGPAKGNSPESDTSRTQSRIDVPSGLERVRLAAKRDKNARFTALLHHVTRWRLEEVYWRIKPKAAAGVDGVTWTQYGESLEENLKDLLARLRRGGYRAKPSRRAYIPKADGRQRPLGVASLEDKIVQGAVVTVLNAIYECDFLGFSYGFRPGRGPHNALDALTVGLRRKVSWVLDADIRGFFDAISHEWLLRFLEHRIADQRILRLIRKWLNAGILENGELTKSTIGTPQGATITPPTMLRTAP